MKKINLKYLKELKIQAALGSSNQYHIQFYYYGKDKRRRNIPRKYEIEIKTPDVWTAIYFAFWYICTVNKNYKKWLILHHLQGNLFIDLGYDTSLWNSLNTKYIFDSNLHMIGARSKSKYNKVCTICTTFGIHHGSTRIYEG
jgi:hypothetical protein